MSDARIASKRSSLVAAGIALGAVAGTGAALWARSRRQPQGSGSFANRVVVITGGSRGLGLALARRFAREGAHLCLFARDASALATATELVRRAGAASVAAFPCDVTKPEDVEAAVHKVLATHDRIDVLVNNAGIIRLSPVEHVQTDDYSASLNTHFWGPLNMIQACLPDMMTRRGGRIVNIASIGGRVAVPHLLPYSVGKFALVGLSEGLHSELAKYDISVTTVTPFLMRTGSHRNVEIRGQHVKEAILFALATATSVTSMNADRAAEVIVNAARDRRATVSPGWQARVAEFAHTVAPESLAMALALCARYLLPAATTTDAGDTLRRSRDLNTGAASSVFPTAAAYRFNQPVAPDEQVH